MIALPIFLPFIFAVACLIAWNKPAVQKGLAVLGALLLFSANVWVFFYVLETGIQAIQVGNWPAPFGITLVVDLLSAVMLVVTGFIALSISIFSLNGIDLLRIRYGFYPLFFFLLMGVNGAFTTGDLFNLYVWFEVMLMASFVLIALGGDRGQLEGAVKYLILNLLSSFLFLSAIGLTYNLAGTLNLAELARQLPQIQLGGEVTLIGVLFLVAFGIKSAIFPLFFWLPASYHTPPVTVTALFSGLLTKVGVYSMLRVFTMLFVQDIAYTHNLILICAGFTMVTGVLGAVAQTDFRRLLSFHIISQIGYLLMGLGLYSQEALAGAIYFMAHVILAKTALFLVAGLVERLRGSYDLKQLGGLYLLRPGLAFLFLLPALSLAGLPPLSGFFAKLVLVSAGLRQQQFVIVAISLAVSLLTLYSMTKIWNEVFWKEPKKYDLRLNSDDATTWQSSRWMWLAALGLVAAMVALSLFADPLMKIADQAAGQLLAPEGYIRVVLGGAP